MNALEIPVAKRSRYVVPARLSQTQAALQDLAELAEYAQASGMTSSQSDDRNQLLHHLRKRDRAGDRSALDLRRFQAEAVMALPGSALNGIGPAVKILYLSGLPGLPRWLERCPTVHSIELENFKGERIDLSGCAELKRFHISETDPCEVVIPLDTEFRCMNRGASKIRITRVSNGVQHSSRALASNPAWSAPGESVQFNGRMWFEATQENLRILGPSHNRKVVCRHMALFWLEQRSMFDSIDLKAGGVYDSMTTPAAFSACFSASLEVEIYRLATRAAINYVVGDAGFSRFAQDIFHEMSVAEVECRRMIMFSVGHAMSLEFRLRKGKYTINFYDPNVPKKHKTIKAYAISHIGAANWRLSMLLDPELRTQYFGSPDATAALVTEWRSPQEDLRTVREVISYLAPQELANPAISRQIVFHGLLTGLAPLVTIAKLDHLSLPDALGILGSSLPNGSACLSVSLSRGNRKAVREWSLQLVRLITDASKKFPSENISSAQCRTLLEAPWATPSIPLLFSLAIKGLSGSIEEWGEVLRAMIQLKVLLPSDSVALLQSLVPDRGTALSAGIFGRNTDCARALTGIMLTLCRAGHIQSGDYRPLLTASVRRSDSQRTEEISLFVHAFDHNLLPEIDLLCKMMETLLSEGIVEGQACSEILGELVVGPLFVRHLLFKNVSTSACMPPIAALLRHPLLWPWIGAQWRSMIDQCPAPHNSDSLPLRARDMAAFV